MFKKSLSHGQDCLKEQEALIPLEQATRQKISKLVVVIETEKSQGSVLKALLQAKEMSEIKGIYGRMGDLGAIDGESFTEKQVDHLPRLVKKVSTPKGVPRLLDLIKVQDERMKLAFFAALRNTIAAENIDKVEKLSNTRQKIADATRCYQALEKTFARMEMELAKSQKEIDSMNMQIIYLEKQLDSLKAALEPRNDELNRLEELKKIIFAEENEIDRLTQGSKQLKEKALELQHKIENAGGERLKTQKSKVNKIETLINEHKDVLDKAKTDYEELKNTVDVLRASEVDADYKLQDMKRA
ncbi:structural maintenance of chromosome 3 [Actinidia rufa]|uniref:Structural maintenance of chromosome 3 n=1 Tax=Actinidia rufa TaxID=165716 RepID=A0A7J0EN42_9ERIC|nr:structural maintenance of chromosome 3 [Actinidia rufa]